MLETIPGVSYVLHKGQNQISLEFPLLDPSRSSFPHETDYLTDMTADRPITMILQVSNITSEDLCSIEPSILFPPALSSSNAFELPRWTRDTMLFDYVSTVESLVMQPWIIRKSFIQELQRISAVAEFDAIDFSSATIILRLTRNKMVLICSVDMTLPTHLSPGSAISLLVHDLQHICDYSLTYSLPAGNSKQATRSSNNGAGGGSGGGESCTATNGNSPHGTSGWSVGGQATTTSTITPSAALLGSGGGGGNNIIASSPSPHKIAIDTFTYLCHQIYAIAFPAQNL
jgi:hypothetical protein